MADRVEQFEVIAPAGTARSAPVEVSMTFPAGEVEKVEVVVPDGVSGLAGIALLLAHSQLIPRTKGSFIISNAEVIGWPMDNLPNSGAWSAWLFNADYFDHTFYVRFLVNEIGRAVTIAEPTTPGDLSTIAVGSGDLGDTTGTGLDDSGDTTDTGTLDGGDMTPPGDTTPPPDDTTPPPDDTTDTGIGDTPPADDTTQEDLPPTDDEPPAEPPAPAPPPPPAPVVIPTYGLPVDYTAGAIPIFGNPANLGMLIGTVLGYKQVGTGSNSAGAYNTWRFFSNLGNTADWNFYTSGSKVLQWVGPFNLRTGVPGG